LKREELTPTEVYITSVMPELAARGLTQVDPRVLSAAIPAIRERARTYQDAAHHLDFYFREPPVFDDKARTKLLTVEVAPWLEAVHALFAASPDFTAAELERLLKAWLDDRGLGMKQVAQPLRVAVTGRSASPPLFDVMEVLGRSVVLARLERAADLARRA
jgi:glutamyl-tRNA synthetase